MNEQHLTANIPTSIKAIESTVLANLTKRQLLTFVIAGIAGISVYMLLYRLIHVSAAVTVGIVIVFVTPIFFAGFYEHNGLKMEKLIYYIYLSQIKRPQIRPYDLRPLSKRNIPYGAEIKAAAADKQVSANTKPKKKKIEKSKHKYAIKQRSNK